ncbi:hypothetical protein UPYG_G00074590 [Umbra pygmaea]|uniref:Uncharacterized protein n=1 Tax=Umbra pygmaea TaxID=75934 RepID=A0ABD0XFL0_UMBPY
MIFGRPPCHKQPMQQHEPNSTEMNYVTTLILTLMFLSSGVQFSKCVCLCCSPISCMSCILICK